MKHARRTLLLTALVTILVLSTAVYVGASVTFLFSSLTPAMESAAYLIGYIMTDACLLMAIWEVRRGRNHVRSLRMAFLCMALRLVYDVLTVLSDGLALSGWMQMDAFLALDVAILIGMIWLLKTGSKAVNLLLVALSAVYLVGEAVGYPMRSFGDWDEFVLILTLLVVQGIPLIP